MASSKKDLVRHSIPWYDPDFYDPEKIDAEMRRVFDICHGCRRCFNLCDTFPRLFDAIDASATGEMDSVPSESFDHIVQSCTLCDMCFRVKCPYVPPHPLNIDFPHLMLRYRAAQQKHGHLPKIPNELAKTDRNGKLIGPLSNFVNWATKQNNTFTRPIIEHVAGIHQNAAIPKFHKQTFMMKNKARRGTVPNTMAPAFGEKVVMFATCFLNYNNPDLGMIMRKVLSHNGIQVDVVYPGCCAMPHLEQGNIPKVIDAAQRVSTAFMPWIDKGYKIIAPVPSCALMLKQEWPLLLPQNDDILRVAESTYDICEYMIYIHKNFGLIDDLSPLGKNISLHVACHARAQNIGQKAAELLRLIPDITVDVIERCSGHGGSWGMMKENFDIAIKMADPVANHIIKHGHPIISSECPLASAHIDQALENKSTEHFANMHPIAIMAKAWRLH